MSASASALSYGTDRPSLPFALEPDMYLTTPLTFSPVIGSKFVGAPDFLRGSSDLHILLHFACVMRTRPSTVQLKGFTVSFVLPSSGPVLLTQRYSAFLSLLPESLTHVCQNSDLLALSFPLQFW